MPLSRVRLSGALFVCCAVFIGVLSPSPTQAEVAPPNVVFILVDDMRFDDLDAVPVLREQIGDAGATFTRFYAPFPLCCPARATLLTGRYPHNHGVLSNTAPTGGWKEFNDSSTLATWLDPTYRTGYIGKYFNEYQQPYVPPGWNEWMVPKSVYGYQWPGWFVKRANQPGQHLSIPGYQTTTMGSLAVDFINRSAESSDPFMLYLSIVAPHAGIPSDPDDLGTPSPSPDTRYRDAFAGIVNTDPSFNEADVSDKPSKPSLLSASVVASLTESFQQRRESLLSVQDVVVRVIAELERTEMLDNTYLVFMSDNGHTLGEHRIKYGKVNPYQVTNRIPMLVRGPGIPEGTVIEDPSSQADFAPTVLAMTQASSVAPELIDGVNLLPRLTGAEPLTRQSILLEATQVGSSSDPLPWQYHGVVDGRWKYLERTTGARELYDLQSDPFELVNLAGRPQVAAEQARLAAMLAADRWCSGVGCRD